MVAGISGATAGSGVAEGDDDNDGRLKLPHAPRNIASTEAIPRLATPRVLGDLTMIFPQVKFLTASVRQPIVKLLSKQ
jgi:hypothetical protein